MYGLQDNSLELIQKLYDFTRCERKDGTAYGTGGMCRKGVQAEKDETSGASLSSPQQVVQSQIIEEWSKIFNLDKQKMAGFYKEVREEKAKILNEMAENRITRGEIDSFVKDHPGKGNFMTAKVITVGMEEPLPRDPTPKQIDDGMAVRFAQERIRIKRGLDHLPKELVVAGEMQTPGEPLHKIVRGETKDIPGGPFWREQASLLTQAGAKNVEHGASYKLYSSKNHAGLELGAIPAASTGAWPVGSRPWVQNVPSVSQALGSRQGAERLYKRERIHALMGQIDKAIANNPNLTTIALAPGKKGAELTNLVFSHLQNKGARIFEKEIGANAISKTIVRVAIIEGAGKKPITIVDPGISVSSQVTREFKQIVGAFAAQAKSGAIEPTGFHRRGSIKESTPRPEVKPMRINDPIEGGRLMLQTLRASGNKDADIRRNFEMLNKIWSKIQ